MGSVIKNMQWEIEKFVFRCFFNKSLKKYKNAHSGERCFVIGNGPSLNTNDLECLKGEVTFACNSIFKSFHDTSWRPTYYLVQDSAYAKGVKREISRVKAEKVFLSTNVLLKNRIYNKDFEYFFLDRSIYPEAPYFSNDFSTACCEGYTVVYSALQLAYYMGFEEVYLIGVDFNYSKVKNIKGEVVESGGKINHFFEGEGKQEIGPLPNLEYSFLAYKEAKYFSYNESFAIKNATRGGKLELFERVVFDSLF